MADAAVGSVARFLPRRWLGTLPVSAIGLGCMNLSHAYGVPPSGEDAGRLLNAALDGGCTMLDTAALYGIGANERLLGRAVMRRRWEFTLASKCVLDVVDGKRVLDGRPEAIKASCAASLARLGTDVIDLYYLHRLDRSVPIEESVGALADLAHEGKIRCAGLSEMSAATIARAHRVFPIAAVQSEYSLTVRNPEVAVLRTCRERGIGFVAFSPLARGLLGGSVTDDDYAPGDIRRSMPRFVGTRLQHNRDVAGRLAPLAAECGCSPAQLALAWLLAQDLGIVPIPGTRSIAHMRENLAAASIAVDAQVMARVSALFPANVLDGPRYNAAAQSQIDTELLPGEALDA